MDYSHLLTENENVLHECRQSKKVFFLPFWIIFVFCCIAQLIVLITCIDHIEMFFTSFFVCAVVLAGLYAIFYWLYKNTLYILTDKKIIVRHGLIGFTFRSIPLESITTMDISVGILDRILGGSTGSIYFANDSSLTFSIFGIRVGYNVFAHIDSPTALIKNIGDTMEIIKKTEKIKNKV